MTTSMMTTMMMTMWQTFHSRHQTRPHNPLGVERLPHLIEALCCLVNSPSSPGSFLVGPKLSRVKICQGFWHFGQQFNLFDHAGMEDNQKLKRIVKPCFNFGQSSTFTFSTREMDESESGQMVLEKVKWTYFDAYLWPQVVMLLAPTGALREDLPWKKNVFFRAFPKLAPPPPLPPIRATWSSFFRRQKRRIAEKSTNNDNDG